MDKNVFGMLNNVFLFNILFNNVFMTLGIKTFFFFFA